jgi:serine/threonine-protein kinase
MTNEFQDRLIQIALRKEYVTAEQVQAVLEKLAQSGRHPRLHRLLIEMRFLTRDQLLDIRRTMAVEGVHPRIADFYVLSRIGRGSMGTVYRAHDRKLDRPVALKLLASHLAADPKFVQRFLREARLAAKIGHPNVVQVFDVGQWRGTHYIVMEHVEGRSLEEIMAKDGPLSEEAAVRIALQIAEALRVAAEKGVLHRDIKPGNILVDESGKAKLADLGLAIVEEDTRDAAIGTPYYMSPEQARGSSEADTRSDIYSLGCTLYHAVTGRPPFEGASAYETLRMHADAKRPDARTVRPELSKPFAFAVRKMMAIRPKDRYQTPDDVAEALSLTLSPRPGRKSERFLWILGIIIAIVAITLMVLTLLAIFGGPKHPLDTGPSAPGRWDGDHF